MKKECCENNIEINNNLALFEEFLKEEHSEKECKDFCLSIQEPYERLVSRKMFSDGNHCSMKNVEIYYALYKSCVDKYYESVYMADAIKLDKKSNVQKTKQNLKNILNSINGSIVKTIILIVTIVLFVASAYIENTIWDGIILSVATGLLASLVYDWLIKFQKRHHKRKMRELNNCCIKFQRIKEGLSTYHTHYLENNNYTTFEMCLYKYCDLFMSIHNLKISLNSCSVSVDYKAFVCYYNKYIGSIVESFKGKAIDEIKYLYLENEKDWKLIIENPYNLAIGLIGNIVENLEYEMLINKKFEE